MADLPQSYDSNEVANDSTMTGMTEGHASGEENTSEERVTSFLKKGADILDTFQQSIRAFEGQATEIKSIGESLARLQQSLHGKRPLPETQSGPSSSKRFCGEEADNSLVVSDSEGETNATEDIDCLMNTSPATNDDHEFLDDFDSFFSEETAVGDNVSEKLANIVNKSVRGHSDPERIKKLKDLYKRPANVDNLQVPRIDRSLWNQLKWQTKTVDGVQQKAVQRIQEGLLPLIVAMNHVTTVAQPDVSTLKTCIGDAFKLLCHNIIQTNTDRRDRIKREIQPKYKSICDNATTATGLFGDTLGDDMKKLDTRAIKVTTKLPNKPFLGKPTWTGPQRLSHQNKSQQHHVKSRQYQDQPQGRQNPYFKNGKTSNRPGHVRRKGNYM